jgi:hypothetical protein
MNYSIWTHPGILENNPRYQIPDLYHSLQCHSPTYEGAWNQSVRKDCILSGRMQRGASGSYTVESSIMSSNCSKQMSLVRLISRTTKYTGQIACIARLRNSLLFVRSFPRLYFPFMWDLWRTKWHRERFCPWEFRFPPVIPRCYTSAFHPSTADDL